MTPSATTPGREGRKADEPARAEPTADHRQGDAAAEIEKVDRQEVRHAAEQRAVGEGGAAGEPPPLSRANAASAPSATPDRKPAAERSEGHQRRLQQRWSPAVRAEAHEVEHSRMPRTNERRSNVLLRTPTRTRRRSLRRGDVSLQPFQRQTLDRAVSHRGRRLASLNMPRSAVSDLAHPRARPAPEHAARGIAARRACRRRIRAWTASPPAPCFARTTRRRGRPRDRGHAPASSCIRGCRRRRRNTS